MRTQSNWISLISWRAFSKTDANLSASTRRLSSGLRINSAADDVSGLGMSQNLFGQFKGLVQAGRNAMDGVSLVNTAEGALQEIHALLQRGRELALQANNGTLSSQDRGLLQLETSSILVEIDRIVDTTTFNERKLLSSSSNTATLASVVNGLRSGWFDNSAELIKNKYGLTGDGIGLEVVFESGGGQPAWITGSPAPGGLLDNLKLHINLNSFGAGSMSSIADDRKIARALSDAILARNAVYTSLPDWFRSGVSSLIAGRDEDLQAALTTHGAAAIVSAFSTPWVNDSIHEAAGYLAVTYLNSLLPPSTMADFMAELRGGNTLSNALTTIIGSDLPTFTNDFLTNGVAFSATLNLSDSDVGGIGGGDNDSVVPDGGTYNETPLAPAFEVNLSSSGLTDPVQITLQVGANFGDTLNIIIPHVSTYGLNLLGLNLITKAEKAVGLIDKAIETVSSARSVLGSMSNRLEATISGNQHAAESQLSSYSRIVDVDYAQEMTNQAKQQILMRSTSAMLAQANTVRQHVLWLLKDFTVPHAGGSMLRAT